MIVARSLAMLTPITDPVATQLPHSFRYPIVVAILAFLLLCFGAGLLARTVTGQRMGLFIEGSALNRIPGYPLLRSLTRSVGNVEHGEKFASAFVELEDGLAPAFVIEEHEDGRYTVFVPSAPTPAVGAIFVMDPARVHFVDAPFMDTVRCVSRFGAGAENLLASMRPKSDR